MAVHIFVDEVKERGYVVAAAALLPGDAAAARKVIESLVMPRQRRLHFHKERDARRKEILDAIEELRPSVVIYDGSARPRQRQRDACLIALVDDAITRRAELLVLERDDSVVEIDKKLIYQRIRAAGHPELRYRHQRAYEEPLLAVPDAIAWCWNRGGEWKRRVTPLITRVQRL